MLSIIILMSALVIWLLVDLWLTKPAEVEKSYEDIMLCIKAKDDAGNDVYVLL